MTLSKNTPSAIRKYRKTPVKIVNTPNVVDFDAAWFLVYTSGNRIMPMALIKLKIVPAKMNSPTITSALSFNDNPPFDESCQGDCSDKRQNTYKQY